MTRSVGWAPSGTTTVAGVIGWPVRHSLSPTLFNAAFAETDLDWTYAAFEVRDGDAGSALDAMRSLGLGGLSVTMPHKSAVAAAVDELDQAAELLGAANCVVPIGDGALKGYNTDGSGFLRSLQVDAGFDPGGKHVALVGAGGAARAVAVSLCLHTLESVSAPESRDRSTSTANSLVSGSLVVINRTEERASDLVSLLDTILPGWARVGTMADVSNAELVVHASPVGMAGTPSSGDLAVPQATLRPGQIVADLVYYPRLTPLLAEAQALGATAVDGLGMLLHQASAQFELWTGQPAPVNAMRSALQQAIEPSRAVPCRSEPSPAVR